MCSRPNPNSKRGKLFIVVEEWAISQGSGRKGDGRLPDVLCSIQVEVIAGILIDGILGNGERQSPDGRPLP